MPFEYRLIGCVLLLGTAAAQPAVAQASPLQEPRWELGLGAALLARPDYRGSAQFSTTVLPVPYVVYRGERVQVSREGLMARLFDSENVRLGLSLSASLPGHDSEDGLRRGMPDLLPTFEAGPSLDWRLGEAGGPGGPGGHWDLRLPVRAVAAADLGEFEGIGWLAYPQLRFSRSQGMGEWKVETAAGIGPLWASRKYHRYFYRVEPQYATPQRPAYDPGSGYSGARATAYLGVRRGAWRLGLGITRDELAGSVMRDSPLVETDHATVVALGVFYALWASEQAAPE